MINDFVLFCFKQTIIRKRSFVFKAGVHILSKNDPPPSENRSFMKLCIASFFRVSKLMEKTCKLMSNFKFFFFSAKSSKIFYVGVREDRNGI